MDFKQFYFYIGCITVNLYSVISQLSRLHGDGVYQLHDYQLGVKTRTEIHYKVKTCYCFSSYVRVILGDIVDRWAKNLRYTVIW